MSVSAANQHLEKVRMELDNKTFQTYSLDQNLEKQALKLTEISSRYEHDKQVWIISSFMGPPGLYIVMQFESEYVVDTGLAMNEDLLNAKYKDKLQPTYKVNLAFKSCSTLLYYYFTSLLALELYHLSGNYVHDWTQNNAGYQHFAAERWGHTQILAKNSAGY
nr:kinesin-like protein KIN-14R [Ipomoea batatas]